MKNKYSYIILAAAIAGLTSCSSENCGQDLINEKLENECSFLSFNPSFDIVQSSESKAKTRLSDPLDANYTYFEPGTYNFGICVMQNDCANGSVIEENSYVPWKVGDTKAETMWRNSGFQSYYNINGEYRKISANTSDTNSELNWYLTSATGKELYLSKDKASVALRRKEDKLPKIFAYYPWQEISTCQKIPVNNFNIDYLYATPIQIQESDFIENDNKREYYRAKLRFNHVTAKVIFDIVNQNKTEEDSIYSAKIWGTTIATSGYYDIANGGFTVGEFGAITSNKEPALVIPAQTKIPDAFTFYIAPISTPTAADGDDFFKVMFDIWSLRENTTSATMPKIAYEKGKQYRITVYISSNRVQFGEPQVEDWIPVTIDKDIIL